jgi:hypothetical protein
MLPKLHFYAGVDKPHLHLSKLEHQNDHTILLQAAWTVIA